jgi:hypothetical protein
MDTLVLLTQFCFFCVVSSFTDNGAGKSTNTPGLHTRLLAFGPSLLDILITNMWRSFGVPCKGMQSMMYKWISSFFSSLSPGVHPELWDALGMFDEWNTTANASGVG